MTDIILVIITRSIYELMVDIRKLIDPSYNFFIIDIDWCWWLRYKYIITKYCGSIGDSGRQSEKDGGLVGWYCDAVVLKLGPDWYAGGWKPATVVCCCCVAAELLDVGCWFCMICGWADVVAISTWDIGWSASSVMISSLETRLMAGDGMLERSSSTSVLASRLALIVFRLMVFLAVPINTWWLAALGHYHNLDGKRLPQMYLKQW